MCVCLRICWFCTCKIGFVAAYGIYRQTRLLLQLNLLTEWAAEVCVCVFELAPAPFAWIARMMVVGYGCFVSTLKLIKKYASVYFGIQHR